MKLLDASKTLVCYPVLFACVGLVAGCQGTRSHQQPSLYSGTGRGAPAPVVSGSESDYATSSKSTSGYATNSAQNQVAVPLYEERVVVGTRSVESGGVRLRKEVITETVNHPVQVRRETLVIDREPTPSGQAASEGTGQLSTPFEAGEIVIRLHSEEPVVETRIVQSGRIVTQMRTNSEQMTVQRNVRREKIGIEKFGSGENVTISENVGAEPREAVGSAPEDAQRLQGEGKAQGREFPENKAQDREEWRDNEEEPFPRPQPDGRLTFPELRRKPDLR